MIFYRRAREAAYSALEMARANAAALLAHTTDCANRYNALKDSNERSFRAMGETHRDNHASNTKRLDRLEKIGLAVAAQMFITMLGVLAFLIDKYGQSKGWWGS